VEALEAAKTAQSTTVDPAGTTVIAPAMMMTPAKIMAPKAVDTTAPTTTAKAATMVTSPMMMTSRTMGIPIVMTNTAQEVQGIPAKIAVTASPATLIVPSVIMLSILKNTEMMMTVKTRMPKITCSCTSSLLKLTKSEVIIEAKEERLTLKWTKRVTLKGETGTVTRKVIGIQRMVPGIATSDQTNKTIRTTEDVEEAVNLVTEDVIPTAVAEVPEASTVPMAMKTDHTTVILPNTETEIATIPEMRTTLKTPTNIPNPIMEVTITAMEATLMINTRATTVVVINLAITMATTMAATLMITVASTATLATMTIAPMPINKS